MPVSAWTMASTPFRGAETRQRRVDEARLHLEEIVVAESQSFHRSRAEPLDDDVALGDQLSDDLLSLGALQVHRDRALVPVVGQER